MFMIQIPLKVHILHHFLGCFEEKSLICAILSKEVIHLSAV
jgi:hypothetical protein